MEEKLRRHTLLYLKAFVARDSQALGVHHNANVNELTGYVEPKGFAMVT